ncbi:type VII secretion target [Hamadaea tsunoensis]|uniref:type VII secretion target n=1 Tax=Hamadaea tsunoensis TaxID=53368 RepID=UPI00040FE63E|nr:type VII secretion target [Hamadaea tsunoensis]
MFCVDTAALRQTAADYGQHADHLAAAYRYHHENSQFDLAKAGLIVRLNPAHDEFVEQLAMKLRQAANVLRDSADGLRRAADAYDITDQASAARIDATLPAAGPPAQRQPGAA